MILDFGNGIIAGGSSTDAVRASHHVGLEFPEVEVGSTQHSIGDGGVIGGSRAAMRRITLTLDFDATHTRAQVARAFSPGVTRTLAGDRASLPYVVEMLDFLTPNLTAPVRVKLSLLSPYGYPHGAAVTAPLASNLWQGVLASGPTISSCRGIAYGNALWLAVGYAGGVYSSADAVTWTLRTTLDGTCGRITFAHGTFYIERDGASLISTTDGLTFTDTTKRREKLGTNGTRLIGRDIDTGTWYYTDNGTSWVSISSMAAVTTRPVYANSKWYAASMGFWYDSPTGTSWTAHANAASTDMYIPMAGSGTRIVGYLQNHLFSPPLESMWYSDDGMATFTGADAPGVKGSTLLGVLDVLSDGTEWYAATENGLWHSANATAWAVAEKTLMAIYHQLAYYSDVWAACGRQGSYVIVRQGTELAVNADTEVPASPVVTVTFGGSAASLALTLGQTVCRVTGPFVINDVLVIDSAAHTITKNGVSAMASFDRTSDWPQVGPGQNLLSVDGITADVSVTYNPRLLGLI